MIMIRAKIQVVFASGGGLGADAAAGLQTLLDFAVSFGTKAMSYRDEAERIYSDDPDTPTADRTCKPLAPLLCVFDQAHCRVIYFW